MQHLRLWFFFRCAMMLTGVVMLSSACVSTGPSEGGEPAGPDRIIEHELTGVRDVVLEFPVGEVEISPAPSDLLHVEMEISCDLSKKSCLKLANKVVLEAKHSGDRLTVGPNTRSRFAYRKVHVNYLVRIPDGVALELALGFGSAKVRNLQNDLRIAMSAGEIDVEAPEHATRNVWLDANIGEATLLVAEGKKDSRSRLVVGEEVDWREGAGRHDINVDVGAGEITVRLTN